MRRFSHFGWHGGLSEEDPSTLLGLWWALNASSARCGVSGMRWETVFQLKEWLCRQSFLPTTCMPSDMAITAVCLNEHTHDQRVRMRGLAHLKCSSLAPEQCPPEVLVATI